MHWQNDFMAVAGWTLRSLDLRYQLLYAEQVQLILETAGIDRAPEQTVIFGIFEAAVASHYRDGSDVMYEAKYPTISISKINPKRADLAFKADGVGQKWNYIEVKKYTLTGAGKSGIDNDISKLKTIPRKCGRYIFTYRIRVTSGKSKRLGDLLTANFKDQLTLVAENEFDTHTKSGKRGVCEYALCRIKV